MFVDFEKNPDRLVPAVVQDAATGKVLMLGYMNAESFEHTKRSGKVTFFSRSRSEIWVKGETSGNFLNVEGILVDCDNDTLLIKATPTGPTCHTGADTCFGETNTSDNFLVELEGTIRDRMQNPTANSYTSQLLAKGINMIAQKVGEEAVELVIAAKDDDRVAFSNEAADLLYHLLVLLVQKDISIRDINDVLIARSHRNMSEGEIE